MCKQDIFRINSFASLKYKFNFNVRTFYETTSKVVLQQRILINEEKSIFLTIHPCSFQNAEICMNYIYMCLK